VSVSAPRLMTHLLKVTMPPSGRLMLPPIQLSPGSYLRFRFFAPGGAPIEWPRVIRTSFDVNGVRIPETSGESGRNEMDPDTATVIGPLPPGMAVLAVDTPPYARMRLRDVRVTGESPLVDAGKVILQPGAALKVTVVDAARVPVVNHALLLGDGMALSPFWWAPVRTDTNGDATFDRLASGRYYLRTAGLAPCGGVYPPIIVRPIDAPPPWSNRNEARYRRSCEAPIDDRRRAVCGKVRDVDPRRSITGCARVVAAQPTDGDETTVARPDRSSGLPRHHRCGRPCRPSERATRASSSRGARGQLNMGAQTRISG
jgi:hypothetical protein